MRGISQRYGISNALNSFKFVEHDSRVTMEKHTTAISRRAILHYLHKSHVEARFPPRTIPPSVEARIRESIESWKLDIPEEVYQKCLAVAFGMGYAAYQHTSQDLQVAISLFTFCATLVDSAIWVDIQAMREFVTHVCTGNTQFHPILDRFLQTATALRQFFPEYTANTLYIALLAFVNEEVCCAGEAEQLVLSPEAEQYVDYSRFRSGISEPYAISIWPKDICPDLAEYIQAIPDAAIFIYGVNDLFSFYKESLEDDATCYIKRYSQVHGKSLEESIDELSNKLVLVISRVRGILGEGRALDAWDQFVSGYTHFHLYCPRYKLSEIVPEYF